jgi:hypothetical protein
LYFRWPEGAKSGLIGPGLDLKAAGGYVVGPPSLHVCGRRYQWDTGVHPDDVPLADAPPWVRAGHTPTERLDVADILSNLGEGNRNDSFCRLTGKLHHAGLSPEDILFLLGPYAEQSGFPTDELEAEVRGICARYDRETWEGITL